MNRMVLLAVVSLLPAMAIADEGMWTFDNPPRAALQQRYGVELTADWLDRVRKGTVRLDGGCTGSFISGSGLILTNHHCAQECIAANSTAGRDLLRDGYLAAGREDELKCQGDSVSVLMRMNDVTAQVLSTTAGLSPASAEEARRAELTRLEQACEEAAARDRKGGALKCEAVTLYQGGQYWIYAYKRYDDVRLVFAPEQAVGSYGGDVDNFQYPRWSLDMSVLRAWEDGKPAATPNRLRFDWTGPEPGEVVFASGFPGGTSRRLTTAELDAERDVFLTFWLLRNAELRGRMIQFGKTGEEPARIVVEPLNGLENGIKVRRKQLDALQDDALFARRAEEEVALAAMMRQRPELGDPVAAYGAIVDAQLVYREIAVRHSFLEGATGFSSELFGHARSLVRAAAERDKPNTERLRAYTDARLPALVMRLGAATPVYAEFEKMKLSFSLERMREWLGPNDPVIKGVLGNDDPDAVAARLVDGSKLADPAVRMKLYEGGRAAIDASSDPMIHLAAMVDAEARALRKRMEDEVDGPTRLAHETFAAARFATLGTSVYPDATFTLRLTYGTVEGWTEAGKPVAPFTTIGQAFRRATGRAPFRLPDRWLERAHLLDGGTPYNFSSSLDITGGNSGSPVLDARGDIVGLVFDGNMQSIAGDYWYDPATNRAVSVHARAIRELLENVYQASALLEEIDARGP